MSLLHVHGKSFIYSLLPFLHVITAVGMAEASQSKPEPWSDLLEAGTRDHDWCRGRQRSGRSRSSSSERHSDHHELIAGKGGDPPRGRSSSSGGISTDNWQWGRNGSRCSLRGVRRTTWTCCKADKEASSSAPFPARDLLVLRQQASPRGGQGLQHQGVGRSHWDRPSCSAPKPHCRTLGARGPSLKPILCHVLRVGHILNLTSARLLKINIIKPLLKTFTI